MKTTQQRFGLPYKGSKNSIAMDILRFLPAGNLNRKAYGFEIKKEFVKGFYDQLFPLIQPDMFSQEEKATKDEQIKQGYFL